MIRPTDNTMQATAQHGHIALAHGGGGQLTDELIGRSILPRFGNDVLNDLLDAAILPAAGTDRIAMTIDGYVVQPWRFPGGDIGRLAVCGTVNDLAVSGAEPLGLAMGLILCEGLGREDLNRVLDSAAAAAHEANVRIVTGDTKVIGASAGEGLFITTAGVGRVRSHRKLSPRRVQPGDVLLINGSIADHGLAVMLAREMPEVQSPIRSDVAPLNGLIAALMHRVPDVVFMRDATRGGLSALGADLAQQCGWHVVIEESQLLVRPETRHAADMLGLDVLDVANEGKVAAVVHGEDAEAALAALRAHPLGRDARIIGRVEAVADGMCELHTLIGGRRVIQKPYGEELPRIC